jgi:AraC-like DNA-binding protein
MITAKLSDLPAMDADASAIFAGRCETSAKSMTNFMGEGRKNNLLCILEEGERHYEMGGGEAFTLYKNELLFIPVTSRYTSRSDPGTTAVCTVPVHTAWSFVDFDLHLGGEEIFLDAPFCILHDAAEFLPAMHAMAAPGASRMAVKGMLLTLLSSVAGRIREREIAEGGFFSIYEAVKAIEQHPERSFSVHELAGMCYLSDTGFREKFKRFTGGIAPVEYRNRLRIERAEAMLASGDYTIEAVAEQLGFWDSAHFCRVWRKLRGSAPRVMSPS